MITVSDDQTVVEVPAKLMAYLAKDGLAGEVVNLIPPIVHVLRDGNYIVLGQRVTDREALGQMSVPDHLRGGFPASRRRACWELNLDSISYKDLTGLINSFQREALHLEMRDSYGTAAEIPHLAKWKAGEPDDIDWLRPWFDTVRTGTQAGKVFRRARIVSEPISDYQKWVLRDSHLFVEAGEDIRWVPRSRVSTVALPGNDFWLFDDQVVIFLIFAASGLVVDRQKTSDRTAIELCRVAFEAVWKVSIPDSEYQTD